MAIDWADPDEIIKQATTITSDQDADNNYYAGLAGRASSISGVPKDWILAQWKHETGNFTSPLTAENNFGGLTQVASNDMKQPDGANYYMRFNSPEEYADYFGRYLKLYKDDGVLDAKTPEEYANALYRGGYYTDDPANYIAGLKNFGATTVRDGSTNTSWLNNIDPDKLLSVVTQQQTPSDIPLQAFQAFDMQGRPDPTLPLQAFQMADIEATSAIRPKVDIENVDMAGTIPAQSDGQLLGAGLNLISSVAEASTGFEKEKEKRLSGEWWSPAAKALDKLVSAPTSAGLEIINQFARPEAALGTLTQHLWDVKQGRQTQDPNALSAAWRGFVENDSDTTRMFKDMGMTDTQAFWANLGRQVIADPLVIAKPPKLLNLAAKTSKTLGVTDTVMPIITRMAKSNTGQRIETLRDFIMGNKPTEALIDAMKSAQASDLFEGQKIAKNFKGATKGMSDAQLDIVNKAMQTTDNVAPITPIPQKVAIDIVDMHNNPNNNAYGTLPEAIRTGAIKKEEAISAFLQQGQEVPRYLLDDRQWFEYQKAIKAAGNAPVTVLVPDAISRANYMQKLEASGVSPDVVQQVNSLIDGWQTWNQGRFNDAMLQKGLFSDETFVRYLDGTHLKRATETYGNSEKFLGNVIKNGTPEERLWAAGLLQDVRNPANTNKIPLKDLVERKNLSPETLEKMGLITNAEYNIMNTVKGSSNVLRKSEYLDNVNQMFGKTPQQMLALETATPGIGKRYALLESDAYGALKGKYVPTNVKADIDNVVNGASSIVPQAWQKAVAAFKIEKLLDIPPIFRNFYSMIPMVNAFGGVPLVGKGISPMVNSTVSVGTDLFNYAKGAQNTLVEKAKRIGLLDTSWTKSEAQALLNYEGEFAKAGAIDKIKWIADKGMQVFASPDQLGRLIVFDYWLKQGKSEAAAAKIAKTALLDYDNAPAWVNFMSKSGLMPFARFPWFAGVETAKALYRDPASVTKYTKAFKGKEDEDRDKILPKYLRGGELLSIGESTRIIEGRPVKVQEHLDMNYILPFFNEFYLGNPLTEMVQIYRTGKASTGMKLIDENMSPEDKARVYAKYVRDSFGPSITSSYGWLAKLMAAQNQEVDYKGRMYDTKDAVMQTFGLKNVPVNFLNEIEKREQEQVWKARGIKSQMSRIEKDATLTPQQKLQRQEEYQRMLESIDTENIAMWQAAKRFKEKGKL